MKMLKVLFFLMFSCVVAHGAIIPTEIIGRAYNDGWWYTANSNYIGPANRGGTAIGFNIAEACRVSMLKGFINGVGDPGGYGYVAMSLHRGSRYGHDNHGPLPSNDLIFASERRRVDFNAGDVMHSDAIGVDLDPGEYWLAFQGGSSHPGHMVAKGFTIEGENMAAVHTPEPATMLLMGGGLLALFRKRRQSF